MIINNKFDPEHGRSDYLRPRSRAVSGACAVLWFFACAALNLFIKRIRTREGCRHIQAVLAGNPACQSSRCRVTGKSNTKGTCVRAAGDAEQPPASRCFGAFAALKLLT